MSVTQIFNVRQGPGAEDAGRELSQKLNEWLGHSGPVGLFRTCATCRKMERPPASAFCNLYGATPPVDVVVQGCDAYEDEAEPPF